MAQQTINIGTVANDGTGDPLRTAFNKANDNFTEVYASLGVPNDSITYPKLSAAYKATLDLGSDISGSYTLDFENYIWFVATLGATTDIIIENMNRGDVKYMLITGDFPLTFTNFDNSFQGKVVSGEYDGTVFNLIQLVKHTNTIYVSIAQVP